MSDLFHNSSGCFDPTAGQALANIRKEERQKNAEIRQKELRERPLVYICSKYAGDVEINVFKAVKFCRYAVSKGMIPVASHLLYPQILDDTNPLQREMGLQFGLALLELCREVWVFNENRELSSGMRGEIAHARIIGKPVRYFDEKEVRL